MWYPFYSSRFSHVNVEHAYFVEGPLLSDAACEGFTYLWSNLQSLLNTGSYSLVFLSVRCLPLCAHAFPCALAFRYRDLP